MVTLNFKPTPTRDSCRVNPTDLPDTALTVGAVEKLGKEDRLRVITN